MPTCDMFCRVIDNFGDAGIAWRLAQSLTREKGWQVRLIIDDAETLSAFVPQVNPATPGTVKGVSVVLWTDEGPAKPADIVIELFSCRLPEAYEAAIAKRMQSTPCAVFALDYLTAESYAEESNGLPSPHPRYGYRKTFLFPGFTRKTCGVIYEKNLQASFAAFREQNGRNCVLRRLGADPAHPFTLYYFAYPQMPTNAFARMLAGDKRDIQIVCAPGAASENLLKALEFPAKPPHIKTVRAPMVPQSDFDFVIASCDAALVRGEDSTMRVQLAGVPLIWTLYPQQEDTHLVKLAAFEKLYGAKLSPEARTAWGTLESFVNNGTTDENAWRHWRDRFSEMRTGAMLWRDSLFAASSLTERISQLAKIQLK